MWLYKWVNHNYRLLSPSLDPRTSSDEKYLTANLDIDEMQNKERRGHKVLPEICVNLIFPSAQFTMQYL